MSSSKPIENKNNNVMPFRIVRNYRQLTQKKEEFQSLTPKTSYKRKVSNLSDLGQYQPSTPQIKNSFQPMAFFTPQNTHPDSNSYLQTTAPQQQYMYSIKNAIPHKELEDSFKCYSPIYQNGLPMSGCTFEDQDLFYN